MWNASLTIRILICIGVCGGLLYSYIDKQNGVTERRLGIPILAKEMKDLEEENTRLQYEIELFESPEHLIQLARSSQYCHLKHPMLKEIVTMPQGIALQVGSEELETAVGTAGPKLRFAIGTHQ